MRMRSTIQLDVVVHAALPPNDVHQDEDAKHHHQSNIQHSNLQTERETLTK
jgi:hypothetical protein